jgi:hypothetical protein
LSGGQVDVACPAERQADQSDADATRHAIPSVDRDRPRGRL